LIEYPESLLGTSARSIVLRFGPTFKSATVSVTQESFVLSGSGKQPGKDKFEYVFRESATFERLIQIRSKKSEKTVANLVVEVEGNFGAPDVSAKELQIRVTPLWGYLEYLNFAELWYWLPRWARRGLSHLAKILALAVALLLLTVPWLYLFPDTFLSDNWQLRLHRAPSDPFDALGIPVWGDAFNPDDFQPKWAQYASPREKGNGLRVRGVAAPLYWDLGRCTLHDFYATFKIDSQNADQVAWAVRFRPQWFDNAEAPNWSGYLFQISGLKTGKPKPAVSFYRCERGGCCLIGTSRLIAPSPSIPVKKLYIGLRGSDSQFWIENAQLDGVDFKFPGRFADPDKRYSYGNLAFFSMNNQRQIDQGSEIMLKEIYIYHSKADAP